MLNRENSKLMCASDEIQCNTDSSSCFFFRPL